MSDGEPRAVLEVDWASDELLKHLRVRHDVDAFPSWVPEPGAPDELRDVALEYSVDGGSTWERASLDTNPGWHPAWFGTPSGFPPFAWICPSSARSGNWRALLPPPE